MSEFKTRTFVATVKYSTDDVETTLKNEREIVRDALKTIGLVKSVKVEEVKK